MAEGKKKSMVPLIFPVLVFLVGLVLGYYFWGTKSTEQIDFKASLQQTITYIATLEHRNARLQDQVNSLENELALLEQKHLEVSSSGPDQVEHLTDRVNTLQRQNEELRATIADNLQLYEENQKLKERIDTLEHMLNTLRAGQQDLTLPPETEQPPGEKEKPF
ncbi:MAG: hypothetical protein RRA35_03950 [Desulfomonilia bacterium]|nr:hypothetical protein [Desulfomonilia bacterium]